MAIPKKCKGCPYLDYVEDDDGDKRSYRNICTKPKDEECKDEM